MEVTKHLQWIDQGRVTNSWKSKLRQNRSSLFSPLPSNGYSSLWAQSVWPGVLPQAQTVYVLGYAFWRTHLPKTCLYRAPGEGWPSPWSAQAGLGWDARVRVSDTRRDVRYYTLHTLQHKGREDVTFRQTHTGSETALSLSKHLWLSCGNTYANSLSTF